MRTLIFFLLASFLTVLYSCSKKQPMEIAPKNTTSTTTTNTETVLPSATIINTPVTGKWQWFRTYATEGGYLLPQVQVTNLE